MCYSSRWFLFMSATIIFEDGTKLNVSSVPLDWEWFDLADELLDRGDISESEYIEILESEKINEVAEGTLDLGSNKHTGNVSSGFNEIQTNKETIEPQAPPDSGVMPAKTRRLGRNAIKQKTETNAHPIQSPFVSPKVSNLHSYQMEILCSDSNLNWISHLRSKFSPEDLKNSKTLSDVSHSPRIHLILDDSGSMRKHDAINQLKLGVKRFLDIFDEDASIGIRWFNSPGLKISPLSNKHYTIVSNGVAKYGNDHAKSLLELSSKSVAIDGDVVVMFTDGKPNGKGINVIEAAGKLKHRGVQIITIGCGDSEPDFMQQVSSPDDHYQVSDISNIASTFVEIGKTLAQTNFSTDVNDPNQVIKVATQFRASDTNLVAHNSHNPINHVSFSGIGFDRIEDFSCYHCRNQTRIKCGKCGTVQCGAGIHPNKSKRLGSKSVNSSFNCANCDHISVIELSDSIFSDAASSGTHGKGNKK